MERFCSNPAGSADFEFTTFEKIIGMPTGIVEALKLAYKCKSCRSAENLALRACAISGSEWMRFILLSLCTLSVYFFVSWFHAAYRENLLTRAIDISCTDIKKLKSVYDGALDRIPILSLPEYSCQREFIRHLLWQLINASEREGDVFGDLLEELPEEVNSQEKFVSAMTGVIGCEFRKIGIEDKKQSYPEKITCQGTKIEVHRPSEALFWTVVDNVYANRPMHKVRWVSEFSDYNASRSAVDEFNEDWIPDCPYFLRIKLKSFPTPTKDQWEAFTGKMEELKETVQALVSYCNKRAVGGNCDSKLAAFESALKKFQASS
ncbi:MAG: hypothetical protein LBH53_01785 [Puniceicoccales bacterium]|nr:hypothetical protein [Puniceicoccales bacterium]